MNVILGISAAGRIGIGKAFILPEQEERKIPCRKISQEEISSEWNRFTEARQAVIEELNSHLQDPNNSKEQKDLLETYLLMIQDPVFTKELQDSFEKQNYNIEHILFKKVQDYAEMLRNSNNDYLAERAQDIEDVYDQVLNSLLNYNTYDIEQVPDGAVIVARSMKTSDTVILGKRKIAGLVLTEGGKASHVAILAKSYGIPAIVGIEDITSLVQQDDIVIVDGNIGEVIIQPDTATITSTNTKILAEEKQIEALKKFKDVKARTEDGTEFEIYANIGTVEEAQAALENGADGIGLFRTEFLFMNAVKNFKGKKVSFTGTLSEEVQFQAYKQVLETMQGKPVTIRTLDAGGDKMINIQEVPNMAERNPLMGLRAIRMSLFYPQVFRTQLRALYRASVYGDLKILLPLITDVSQVDTALKIIKGVQFQLRDEGIPFNPDVPVGVMIETAAAAITADCIAQHAKFFSIGTNDLTQYILGVDRENQAVTPLYNEFSLAVLRMIRSTIFNANMANIPLSVCGEMAGNKESAIILAGMGVRKLSMAPSQIPLIKETLSHFSITELENLSKRSVF
ncbi:MAG: phosphoenolpyruvate--protein phosphotransferase [Treponema sp.]|nr:phosphoenolpyruvate--protein phosphotransferase [Treponema sp.]